MDNSGLRYYVHGDLEAGASDWWYCAACDVFAGAEHFAPGGCLECRNHLEQHRQSLQLWHNLQRRTARAFRPTDASNRFR